jgi:hypothetical protein
MIPPEKAATFRDHAIVGCHMGHPPPPVKPAGAAPGADRAGGRLIGAGAGNEPMLRCKKLTPAMFIPYLLQASPQFCHASCGSRNHRLCGLA